MVLMYLLPLRCSVKNAGKRPDQLRSTEFTLKNGGPVYSLSAITWRVHRFDGKGVPAPKTASHVPHLHLDQACLAQTFLEVFDELHQLLV
jgi:hypothetical protein